MACKSEQAHLKHLKVPYLFMGVTWKTRIHSFFFLSQQDFFSAFRNTSLFPQPWFSVFEDAWGCACVWWRLLGFFLPRKKEGFALEKMIINCKILTAKIVKPFCFKICLNLIGVFFCRVLLREREVVKMLVTM